MSFAAITQSLKSPFESYTPQLSSTATIVGTGVVTVATLAYQRFYGGTLTYAFLAGAACVATAYLRLRERVTLVNVMERLKQLDGDLKTSIQKGDFAAKKTLFTHRYNAIREVFVSNSNQNLYKKFTWENAIEVTLNQAHQTVLTGSVPSAKPFLIIRSTGKGLPKPFVIQALHNVIFSFLGVAELALTSRVSSSWYNSINTKLQWKQQCARLIPGSVPEQALDTAPTETDSINYRQLAKDFYPEPFRREFYSKFFGKEFYQSYYGVDVSLILPIPFQLLKKADVLIFVPEYLSMILPADSPLGLDHDGKLTADPNQCVNRPRAVNGKRVLRVPVTLNNFDILTKKYLKKGAPTGINCGGSIGQRILQQHGNAHFPSHWSAQKRELMGQGLSFIQQQAAAQWTGLEIVSLLDRVLFNLFHQVRRGTFVESKFARTATIVLDEGNRPWQASINPSDPSYGLDLWYNLSSEQANMCVGIAVGVSSGLT